MGDDFIDITPPAISPSKPKRYIFQETEWAQIRENYSGLTKEGVEEKVKLWKGSSNRHVLAKYQTMLAQCKKLVSSGKTKDGKIVLGKRKDGTVWWTREG